MEVDRGSQWEVNERGAGEGSGDRRGGEGARSLLACQMCAKGCGSGRMFKVERPSREGHTGRSLVGELVWL